MYETLSEVREHMNSTYFHGLNIVKKDTLPTTLRNQSPPSLLLLLRISPILRFGSVLLGRFIQQLSTRQ